MMRASIYLPEELHQRLVLVSRRKKTNMSDLVRHLLDEALADEQEKQRQEVFQGLEKLKGFIKDPVTNASETVDEVLYGEHGAWRGTMPDDGEEEH